jgi:hypothetical protein
VAEQIPTIDEWVDQLLATAPPVTGQQRELAVRLLAMPPEPAAKPSVERRPAQRRAA